MTSTDHRPGDLRRAVALLVHFAAEDTAGVEALLEETADTGRLAELIGNLLAVTVALVPDLAADPRAREALSGWALDLAAKEGRP